MSDKKVVNILAPKMKEAEEAVDDIQTQLEAENLGRLDERITEIEVKILLTNAEIKSLQKQMWNVRVKLSQLKQKRSDLVNSVPPDNSNFNEDEAIVTDIDMENMIEFDEAQTELEQNIFNRKGEE